MSGDVNFRWRLAQHHEACKSLLLELRDSFGKEGSTIYRARNELKKTTWIDEFVVIKSFGAPGCIRRYVYGNLRKTKARKSYENSVRLASLGINTPEPIGFVEYFRNGGLEKSFYACKYWPHQCTLREPLENQQYAQRDKVLSAIGMLAFRLHQNGVYFRDFSPGNILLSVSTADLQELAFALIDTNRIQWGRFGLKQRMKMFSMLWLTDEDLKKIVASYCLQSRDDPRLAQSYALRQSRRHKNFCSCKERLKKIFLRDGS